MIKEVVTVIPIDELLKTGIKETAGTLARVFEGAEEVTVTNNHREIIVSAAGVGTWIYWEPPEAALPAARTLYFYDEEDGTVSFRISDALKTLAGPLDCDATVTELLTNSTFAESLARAAQSVANHYRNHHDAGAVCAELSRHLDAA